MLGNFFTAVGSLLQFLIQGRKILPQTTAVFKALSESITPLSRNSVSSRSEGDRYLYEYYIYILDHYVSLKVFFKPATFGLANATANMLNIAAKQLIDSGENEQPADPAIAYEYGMFAALQAKDRCRVISLLEHLQVDLSGLPVPFYKNPGTVVAVVSILTMLGSAGYYSEWTGYGTTRSGPPAARILAQYPASWQQVDYPGPAMGHHVLRGYIIDKFTE